MQSVVSRPRSIESFGGTPCMFLMIFAHVELLLVFVSYENEYAMTQTSTGRLKDDDS